ncbi:MAG: 16S rRNA (guanine(527)-N(7))-methyltransferase RsmG [Pseudomonadota bacterium]
MSPDDFARASNVSRETLSRLEAMDSVLMEWSVHHNLIARSTIKHRWERHFLDSAQLASFIPSTADSVLDLGSGAGFPGLVIAAALADRGASVTLVEATGKKAAFLRAAAEAMEIENITVLNQRIEGTRLPNNPDIITARALARLDKLLEYAHPFMGDATKCFFHKGQDFEAELNESANTWEMDVTRHKSVASPNGTILEIGNLTRAR